MSDEKGEYDEVHGDIFSNLFQDPIADNSMQESSSLSLEIFLMFPYLINIVMRKKILSLVKDC
jgi:hypothetical protein